MAGDRASRRRVKRTGETLVTIQVRCPAGCGPKALQDAFELWLRKRGCEVVRASVVPVPPPPAPQ